MRPRPPTAVQLLLAIVAVASLALGVTSFGPRGLLLGVIVPTVSVAALAVVRGFGSAVVLAIGGGLAGIALAGHIGANTDAMPDPIILYPVVIIPFMLGVVCVVTCCHLAVLLLLDR